MKDKRIWTLKQFCSYFAWPTFSGMRHRFEMRHENGYKEAFLKDGKRVLVDVDKFWELLENKQNKEK